VLVLDDVRIMQVHLKGIAHPTKAFLDVIGQFSRLIKKDASPNLQRVGGISLLALFGYGGAHSSCHSPEEDCDPGPGDVGQGILFTITRYRH
jgi:hypothetical protein